jgi:hypothetical protein
MDEMTRERRLAELRVLQFNNPRSLIEQYWKIAGESSSKQMPQGVSFSKMIEAIIDHEAATNPATVTTK